MRALKNLNLKLLLALLVALTAFLLRLQGSATLPYYPDEGMVAETSWRLSQGLPLAVGAVKQTALFPITTSPLPLLGGALAQKLFGGDALRRLRLWSMALGALTCGALVWVLWALSPLGAVLAGTALALMPLARLLDQMGFYHHLGALVAVGVLGALLAYQRGPVPRRLFWLGAAAGLAVAAAYWSLWLLVLPIAAAWTTGRRGDLKWLWIPLLMPMAAVLAWSYFSDPASFGQDLLALKDASSGDLPGIWNHLRAAFGFSRAAQEYPSLWLGLGAIGLVLYFEGAARWTSATFWLVAWACLVSFEVFRQRQNLEAFSYPLILVVAPLAALLSLVFVRGLAWARSRRPLFLLLPLCLGVGSLWSLAKVPHLLYMNNASARPWDTQRLIEALPKFGQFGDLIIGQTNINWALAAQGYRVTDLDQVALASGMKGLFMAANLPASRYTFVPRLDQAKLLILSPYSHGIAFAREGTRRIGLMADKAGWTKLREEGDFSIYGNPAMGFKAPKTAERILKYYNLYDLAAQEAFDRQEYELAYFGALQALPYVEGDRQARLALLAKVQAVLARNKAPQKNVPNQTQVIGAPK